MNENSKRYTIILLACLLLLYILPKAAVACYECEGVSCPTCKRCSAGVCIDEVGTDCGDCKKCYDGECEYTCRSEACQTCINDWCEACNGEPMQSCCDGTCFTWPENKCCDDIGGSGDGYSCAANEICCKGDCCDSGMACCDGTCYDPLTQGCCDGTAYNLSTQGCCDGTVYNLSTQGCCDNLTVYTKATEKCCSEGTGHTCQKSPVDKICCNGSCCTPPECCDNGACVNAPICDNCQSVSDSQDECGHPAGAPTGSPCNSTVCIKNTIDTASCTYHSNNPCPTRCKTETANPWAPEVDQKTYNNTSCSSAPTVSWSVWHLLYYSDCSTCTAQTPPYTIACTTSSCSGGVLWLQRTQGSSQVCGTCP